MQRYSPISIIFIGNEIALSNSCRCSRFRTVRAEIYCRMSNIN